MQSAKPRNVLVFLFGIPVALIVGCLALLWRSANVDPVIVIPVPEMPAVNALDLLVEAGKAVSSTQEMDDALLNGKATTTVARAFLKRNQIALTKLREGFRYPYRDPPLRSMDQTSPHYSVLRSLARLLHAEAQAKASQRDYNGAVNSMLDGLYLGEQVPHGACLIGKLVGLACQSIARKEAWELIGHLNAAQARSAAERMHRIMEVRAPMHETLLEEKISIQASLMRVFQKRDWRNQILSPDDPTSIPMQHRILSHFMVHTLNKRRIMKAYTDYMDYAIAQARLPYAQQSPDPAPTDGFCLALAPVTDQARFRDTAGVTSNRLLYICFALQAFRKTEGRYPASLSQLVPAYLKQIPGDPFARSPEAMRYRSHGIRFLLYSVGPDGEDDGGRPMKNDSSADRFRIVPEGRGDIVAGVNDP